MVFVVYGTCHVADTDIKLFYLSLPECIKIHFTHTVLLSTQGFKWVPTNLILGSNPVMDQGGLEFLLITSSLKHWPDGSLGMYADFN